MEYLYATVICGFIEQSTTNVLIQCSPSRGLISKLELAVSLAEFFRLAVTAELTVLPISPAIAERVATLEAAGFHRDPADQLIVATALVHGLRLVSDDSRIRQWGGVPLLWRTSRARYLAGQLAALPPGQTGATLQFVVLASRLNA